MNQYLVHFNDEITPSFLCWAEDWRHAKEQAENAYPNAEVFSVFVVKLVWHSLSGTEFSILDFGEY